jgi:hypothetical protein
VILDHVDSMCFLPLVITLAFMFLLGYLSLHTFRTWFYGWVELLSSAVMSHHTSLPSFMMLSLACV